MWMITGNDSNNNVELFTEPVENLRNIVVEKGTTNRALTNVNSRNGRFDSILGYSYESGGRHFFSKSFPISNICFAALFVKRRIFLNYFQVKCANSDTIQKKPRNNNQIFEYETVALSTF